MLRFGTRGVADLGVRHEVTVDPVTGAGLLTVPVPSPEGRADLSPGFSLAYSSSGGNSSFGAGWSLAGHSAVGIDTRERLPRWDGGDALQLDGDEIVPWLVAQGADWQPRTRSDGDFTIALYRPRLRSIGRRIERWTHRPSGRVHFRVYDARGVVTIYGARPAAAARIADPKDESRTFAWLPELQLDPSGNAMWFEYAAETVDGVDLGAAYERRQPSLAQRYLKRVRYGNRSPLALSDDVIAGQLPQGLRFCFQLVFDYGDHSDADRPSAQPDQTWPARPDPFSTCRQGFEVRTWRLCRRILSFHEFDELGPGPTLVGALALEHDEDAAGSTLRQIRWTGYRRDEEPKSVPPLRMTYAPPQTATSFTEVPIETRENVPAGVGARQFAFVDVFGEGLPGILAETDRAWYYKPNQGGGTFGAQIVLDERPAGRPGSFGFGDFDRDGDTDYSRLAGRLAGAFELDRETERWNSFKPFEAFPHVEAFGRRAQWIDLDGDGRPDLVVGKDESFLWFPSRDDGFDGPVEIARPPGAGAPPTINADVQVDLFFADMNGDGLVDLVRVQNGRIEYWPHLGNGRFGDAVVMDGAPEFAAAGEFDPARLRFVDLDGSGTADLVYVGRGEVRSFINASGNRWQEGPRLSGLPYVDNQSSVSVLDFLGDGRSCLVWSTPLPGAGSAMAYLPLTPSDQPRLLVSIDNALGQKTRLEWSSSASHYLRDQRSGRGWSTRLPQHHPVVDRQITVDAIGGTEEVRRYEYHDGYYDGRTRELRGFGQVDVYDAQAVGEGGPGAAAFAPPSLVRSWYHLGTAMVGRHRPTDTYDNDAALTLLPPHVVEDEGAFAPGELEDGLRALAGQLIRRETWATDAAGAKADHPFEVVQTSQLLRRKQPALGEARAAFSALTLETVAASYEQVAGDPRVVHHLAIEVDDLDRPTRVADIAYPRRAGRPRDTSAQDDQGVVVSELGLVDIDQPARFELGIPIWSKSYQLVGLRPGADGRLVRAQLREAGVVAALSSPVAHHLDLPDDPALGPRARRLTWEQSFYWNDARSQALPLGQIGALTMVHHEEAACFAPEFIADVLGNRVDDARLGALRYLQRDGLWWQVDPVHRYAAPAQFSLPLGLDRADGATSSVEYDDYALVARVSIDAAGNRTEAALDYHLLAPWRLTDPNGNVSEVRYDPLGIPVAATTVGHVGTQPWGFDALAQVVPRTPANLADAVGNPAPLLQGAARYQWYDLDAWSRDGTPPVVVALSREDLRNDGAGGGVTDGRIQVALSYLDGLGRTLQQKTRVEPGPAIQRDASGAVVVDAGGQPVLAPAAQRWRASGHVVYDRKQRPGRQFEPFFTPSFAFEGDEVLGRVGVATTTRYDAIGRRVGQDHPNGTFTRTTYGPWSVDFADANDTVLDSAWRTVREGLPADDPQKQALEEARPHAGTTRTVFLDPFGREVVTLARGGTTDDRRAEVRLSVDGQVSARIDARGLTAFTCRRDMQGRSLYERSIDAGELRSLPDGFGREALSWNARGFEIERSYDALDRLLTVHVRGGDGPAPLDHRVLERSYGESLANAAANNLRGQVVRVRDGAGEVTTQSYDPGGKLLAASRRLRTVVDREPDWRGTVPLDAETFTVSAVFDAFERPRRETLPDGSICEYQYQLGGPIDRVRITTPDGRLTEKAILDGADYDALGQRLAAHLGNGVDLGWSFEPDTFRPSSQTARLGTRLLQDLRYTYDPVGNLVRLTDAAQEGAGALIGGATVPARRDYVYDAHYRLRRATGRVHQALLEHDWVPGNSGTVKGTRHLSLNNGAALERFTRSYDYDAAGNLQRIRHVGASQRFTTEFWISPASNRSQPALDLNGNPVQNPESRFDAAGNLRVMDHLRALEWGWNGTLGRAVTIARPGGTDDDERYVYGADGKRIRKITTRVVQGVVEVTEKLYFGACERKRIRQGSTVILERWTAHVGDGTNRLAIVHRWTKDDLGREVDDLGRPRVRYQLGTHQGSCALELDENGALISYEEYFPYGGSAFIAGDDLKQVELKEYRYSAKERDDATSFYYYGYRYYAPWMGRWLSPDPIGPKDDLNLYQFVLGDPVGNVDPDGLDTEGGGVRYVYEKPAKAAPDLATAIQNRRDSLKKVYRAGFDSLSEEDKKRFVLEDVILVPRDPTDPKGDRGWTLLTEKQYQTEWLPARREFAKSQHKDVIVTIQTENPARLPPSDGGTSLKLDVPPAPPEVGAKKDPWATDAKTGGSATDASTGEDKNAKDSGDGTGSDKTGSGKDGGKGKGDGGGGDGTGGQGVKGGTGPGKGPGGIGTEANDVYGKFGGMVGGREEGVTGGTPFSTGHTPGGMGSSPDGPGAGVGTGTGGRSSGTPGGVSPTGAGSDLRPGTGSTRDTQSQGGSATGGAAGSPSSNRADGQGQGEGPGGAGREGGKAGGHEHTAWDTFMTIGEIAALQLSEEGGSEHGVPGGFGWLKANRFIQGLAVCLSIIDFISMATGIGELIEGMFDLVRGLFRLGKKLLTELPNLLRLGWRGLRRLFGALVRFRELFAEGRAFFSRLPKDIFIIGADAMKGQSIRPLNLFRELLKSKIGRETLELIDKKGLSVILSHQVPLGEKEGSWILGHFIRGSDTVTAYVLRTKSLEQTAMTVIHEVTHAVGILGTQRAEIIAEIRALKHIIAEPSVGDIRAIISRVKALYTDLPYK